MFSTGVKFSCLLLVFLVKPIICHAKNKDNKVSLCHVAGSNNNFGGVVPLQVSRAALQTHQSHGDWLAEEEDKIYFCQWYPSDNNCEPINPEIICSNHGSCQPDGSACVCQVGWFGPLCDSESGGVIAPGESSSGDENQVTLNLEGLPPLSDGEPVRYLNLQAFADSPTFEFELEQSTEDVTLWRGLTPDKTAVIFVQEFSSVGIRALNGIITEIKPNGWVYDIASDYTGATVITRTRGGDFKDDDEEEDDDDFDQRDRHLRRQTNNSKQRLEIHHDAKEDLPEQGQERSLQAWIRHVDIMVLWTKSVECRASYLPRTCTPTARTEANMKARVNAAVASANDIFGAFENGADIRLRISHLERDESYEELYNDTSAFTDARNHYSTDATIHAKRVRYGADVVSAWIDYHRVSSCGKAFRFPNQIDKMFSVLNWRCVPYYSFIHEILHNFGCEHDRASLSSIDGCNDPRTSFGFADGGGSQRFRTIMARFCFAGSCEDRDLKNCPRIPQISSNRPFGNYWLGEPLVNWPVGDERNNNIDQINSVKDIISGYYRNACLEETPCGVSAECTNDPSIPSGYTCACADGYEGDPYSSCMDIDECATGTHDCDSSGFCANLPGTYTCQMSLIGSGIGYSCALSPGSPGIKCWGENSFGQLGNGDVQSGISSPVDVALPPGSTAVNLAVGGYHSCAILDDGSPAQKSGSVWCWGSNSRGQLGDGSLDDRAVPVEVPHDHSFTVVAAGLDHTCAISSAGQLFCWGSNFRGQCGVGSFTDITVPGLVAMGGHNVKAVALGGFHTCAIRDDGAVACWGNNLYGQLGFLAGYINEPTPTLVSDASGQILRAKKVVAGNDHTCAILLDGSMACWGQNDFGQLASPPTGFDKNPVPLYINIGAESQPKFISAGRKFSCVVLADGQIKCWGENRSGKLGQEQDFASLPYSEVPIPVDIGEDRIPLAIACGNGHTCILLDEASVLCWGALVVAMAGGRTLMGSIGDEPMEMGDNLVPIPDVVVDLDLASLATFRFDGVVTVVPAITSLGWDQVQIGDPWRLKYTFDTGAAEAPESRKDPGWGEYRNAMSLFSLQVASRKERGTSQEGSSFRILDNTQDSYQATVRSPENDGWLFAGVYLFDSSASVFASDELPMCLPDLSGFDSVSMGVAFSLNPYVEITGSVDLFERFPPCPD